MNTHPVSSVLRSNAKYRLLLLLAAIFWTACREGHSGIVTVQLLLKKADSVSIVVSPQNATPADTLTFRVRFAGHAPRPLFFRWTFGASYQTIEGLDLDSVRYKFASYKPVDVRVEISDPNDPSFHLEGSVGTQRQPMQGELTFDSLGSLRMCSIELTLLKYYTTDKGLKRTDSTPILFRAAETGDWVDKTFTYFSAGYYQPYGAPPVYDTSWAYALFDESENKLKDVRIGAAYASPGSDPSRYKYVMGWIEVQDVPIASVAGDTVIATLSGDAVRSHIPDIFDESSSVHWGNSYTTAGTLDSIGWYSALVRPRLRVVFTKR